MLDSGKTLSCFKVPFDSLSKLCYLNIYHTWGSIIFMQEKPSKNHWKQWSGGWKSLNGDGWMTPKTLKNHRVQWSVIKKVVNGDGQRGAKPSKNHWCQWFSREKNHHITSLPKNDHCSPLAEKERPGKVVQTK